MPLVFVDTNVLLYAVDEADATKQQRARDWLATCWQRRIGRVSSQVMHEFYWNARRKFAAALSAPDARAAVRRYQAWKKLVLADLQLPGRTVFRLPNPELSPEAPTDKYWWDDLATELAAPR